MNKLVKFGFNVTYEKDVFDGFERYTFTRKVIVGGSNYSDVDSTYEKDQFTVSVSSLDNGRKGISMWFNFYSLIDNNLLHAIDDFVKELEEEDGLS